MKNIIITILCACSLTCFSQDKSKTLTNASIIEMKNVGLPKSTIKSMIESSPCNFEVDMNSIIALKKKGIEEEVLNAMIAKASSAGTSIRENKPANDSSSKIVGLLAKSGNGIYYYKPDVNEVQELEPTVYSQAKQGSGLLTSLTYGIAKTKSKLSVSGASANIQLSDKRPRFYFYFDVEKKSLGTQSPSWFSNASSPNEFMVVRFDINKSKSSREIVSGSANAYAGASSGVDDGNRKGFKYRKIQPGIYEIYFETDVSPGEYCFMYAGAASGSGTVNSKVYDFGIK